LNLSSANCNKLIMGQVCFASEENEARILELENLLKDQELEKEALRRRLEEEKDRQKQFKNAANGEVDAEEKIEQLTNEKKTVFKQMLKERKNVSKLEDSIQDYKTQLSDLEVQLNELKAEKERARKRAEEAEREKAKKQKSKKNKLLKLLSDEAASSIAVAEPETKPLIAASAGGGSSGAAINPLGSTLAGIQIKKYDLPDIGGTPNIGGSKSTHTEQNEQKTKPSVTPEPDGSSSEDEEADALQQTTTMLDLSFDPQAEATHVYSWIHGGTLDPKSKQDIKQLKMRLSSLLTSRSEGFRQQLVDSYREQYGKSMEKDIKAVIQKGHALEIICGLLVPVAEYDARLIAEYVQNWDIEPIADIICCRSLKQLKDLHAAYRKLNKLNVRKQLQALAQKDKKRTLVKVIGSIFDLDRTEAKDVDMQKVNEDLSFAMTTKSFKGDTKERLILIFTANSTEYIKVFAQQFKIKQGNDDLPTFIDKKLGPKSTAGHFCKTRILYAVDTPDYFAKTISKLGTNYKKNQKKISDIFIQRMEVDLWDIHRAWAMGKYGGNKDLKQWIASKTGGSKAGYLLQKMLENCERYAQFQKKLDNKDPTAKRNKALDMM